MITLAGSRLGIGGMSTRPPPRLREEVRVLRLERVEDVPVAIVPVDADAEGVLGDELGIPAGAGAPPDAVAGFGAAIPQTLQ
jgi:hypothetical protein